MITAGEFLNYCKAGLTLVGRNEEGELKWVGTDKNWNVHSWLEDGAEEESKDWDWGKINNYLKS